MVSAPVNVYTAKTANQVAKVRVLLGPADGSADEFTETFDLIPIEIAIMAGAQPDYAVFEFKTDRITEIVDATETVTGKRDEFSFNRQVWVRVHARNSKGNVIDGDYRTLFWGELLTETLHIDPFSQRITVAARVAPYHFGGLLEGEYHWDANSGDSVLIAVDPVFNPLIDGIIEGNRAAMMGQALPNGQPVALTGSDGQETWVDPDAVRTEAARLTIGEASTGEDDNTQIEGDLWDLNQAVSIISTRLIADSGFVFAPDTKSGSGTIWDDQPVIKNLKLPRGRHLHELLDMLLIPHGYAWYLDHSSFDPDVAFGASALPEIICFRRGDGINRSVKLQPTGEELDLAKTNTSQIDLRTDVGNLTNKMYGWGSFEQKELTLELFRGWPEADDALTAENLRRSDVDSIYNVSQKHEAWRLWVGNEAGDYTDTRETVAPIASYLDLSGVFGRAVPTRRMIDDCLTLDAEGKRRPPYLEWWPGDESREGWTEPRWEEVPPEWGWVILPDQIGILFTGDIPPELMIDAGDDCKVRITATVTGDERLNSDSAPNLDESPSLREVPLFLDLSDRFHKRSVQADGDLASVLADDENGADEVDDASELQDYLAAMLETELSAEMQSSFRLHGIHTDYEISDLIISVEGRDIFLNRNAFDADANAQAKYPQVYGIRWLFQEQVTEIITEAVG